MTQADWIARQLKQPGTAPGPCRHAVRQKTGRVVYADSENTQCAWRAFAYCPDCGTLLV